MGNFAKQMKIQAEEFDRIRQENQERRRGTSGAPEGDYQMKVTDAVIEKGTKGGLTDRWYYRMMFRVVGGKQDGTEHEKFGFLDSVKNGRNVPLNILIADLDIMGISATPNTLEDDILQSIGCVVQMTVKQAKNAPDRLNSYVNSLIQGNGSSAAVATDDEEEEEEAEEPQRRRGRPKGSKNKKAKKKQKAPPADDEEEESDDEFDAFLEDDED